LVKAELLFPDEKQRALYRELPAEPLQGKRAYGFELKPQPGMQPNRHFHLVTVAVAPAAGVPDAGLSTLAGPNGAFTAYTLRTADERFDITVSDGNLLPNRVDLPPFDLTRGARALADRYDSELRGARWSPSQRSGTP
jgi:hypothetical protein